MQQKRFNLAARIPFLIVLALAVLLYFNYQHVRDWARLYSYTPPAAVRQLSLDTTLTPYGEKLFYVNHPEIQDRQAFNQSCSRRSEHTIVLGCYHPVDRGIYIFHVSEPRLRGVDQVTAAHEMLHAAYDRLSSKERDRINGLLTSFYETHDDERIKAIIAAYEETVPEDVVNEMHSIFATEIADLPPELETYYSRYFKDRSAVVAFATAYQQEFTARQDKVKAIDEQLANMKTAIDTNSAELEAEGQAITAARRDLDAQRENGNFEAYNAAVPGYNAMIDTYNRNIASAKQLISDYNSLVAERNTLALQVAELADSIDSNFTPIYQ